MSRTQPILILVVATTAASIAAADSFVEEFNGTNEGGWSYLGGDPSLMVQVPKGGNPGAFLGTPGGYATFLPQLHTLEGTDSVFTGDYAAAGVSSLGVDLRTGFASFSTGDRPIVLMLINDNGTPGDLFDDWGYYNIGPNNMPAPDEGWIPYHFDVDSQAAAAPAGWTEWTFDFGAPFPGSWPALMQDVDQVIYSHGDPTFFYILQDWALGVDNARISFGPDVTGDLNGDGVVDGLDLGNLLANWSIPAGSPGCGGVVPCAADLNGDGVVDGLDLGILLANWTL